MKMDRSTVRDWLRTVLDWTMDPFWSPVLPYGVWSMHMYT